MPEKRSITQKKRQQHNLTNIKREFQFKKELSFSL